MRPAGEFSLTGRHVLGLILGFFGLVAAVNFAMVWLALDSWPGLNGAGYRNAAAQRALMAEAARRAALGWHASLSIDGTGLTRTVTAEIRDAGGNAVPDLALTAVLRRLVSERFDRRVPLEPAGHVRHVGRVTLPAAGNWSLRLAAHRDGREVWAEERALWLK